MTAIRVLLADDHTIMRSSIRSFLEDLADIQLIGEAADGLQALELTRKLMPDVILLDMEMPRMTGVEVAHQLQVENLPVRILALSAYDDWQYIKNLLDSGAAGYLIKAEVPELIAEAVRGVARGERGWISRQVARQMAIWSRTGDQITAVPLTGPEKAVLRQVVAGDSNQQIGAKLGLRTSLVETYLETAFAKLGVDSKETAAKKVAQAGLV